MDGKTIHGDYAASDMEIFSKRARRRESIFVILPYPFHPHPRQNTAPIPLHSRLSMEKSQTAEMYFCTIIPISHVLFPLSKTWKVFSSLPRNATRWHNSPVSSIGSGNMGWRPALSKYTYRGFRRGEAAYGVLKASIKKRNTPQIKRCMCHFNE